MRQSETSADEDDPGRRGGEQGEYHAAAQDEQYDCGGKYGVLSRFGQGAGQRDRRA